MKPAVFRTRLALWKALEMQYGRETTPSALEKRCGVNHGLWTMWEKGTSKYMSQQMPSEQQWGQLRLLGFTWHAVFEDVYAGVKEMELPNRQCPICGNEFRAHGHQLYDIWFCRDWAAHLREINKRKAPAVALRAV